MCISLQLLWPLTPTLLTVISSCPRIWPVWDTAMRSRLFLIIQRDSTCLRVFWAQRALTLALTAGTLRSETVQAGSSEWWPNLLRGEIKYSQGVGSGWWVISVVNIKHMNHHNHQLSSQWKRNCRGSEFSWTGTVESCRSLTLLLTHTYTLLHTPSLKDYFHFSVLAVTFLLCSSYL